MSSDSRLFSAARRSFLSRVGVGAAAFGAVGRTPALAQTRSAPFQPAKHAEDDWMDQLPGKHRLTLMPLLRPEPTGSGVLSTITSLANKSRLQSEPSDLAVIVILRHHATPFAYNDAIWAKHGAAMSEELKFTTRRRTRCRRITSTTRPTTRSTVSPAAECTSQSAARPGYFAGVAARKAGGTPTTSTAT